MFRRLNVSLVALFISGCAVIPSAPLPPASAIAPGNSNVSAPSATVSSSAETPQDVGIILTPIVARTKVPGMAAVVLNGDKIVAQGAAGVRKRGSNEPITIDDQFLLCSAGKAMTATLAAMLIDEGRLSWNTTLGDIFSDTIKDLHPDWKAVTLAQLLEHRAGVPADEALFWPIVRLNFSRGTVDDKRWAIVSKVLSKPPPYPPGSRYVYASADYVIVGAMLEKITGQTWEELIQKSLWEPLGITSAGFGAPGTPGKIDQPWGHWGMMFTGRPSDPDGLWAHLSAPLFGGPAGTGHMTITDWSRFISLHLRGDPANPHQAATLLKPDSFAALHRAKPGSFYQAGWILLHRSWANGHRPGDTGRVISSQGDNGFWHCEAWVAPEIDFAVLVVCNQGGPADDKPATIADRDAITALIQAFGPNKIASR